MKIKKTTIAILATTILLASCGENAENTDSVENEETSTEEQVETSEISENTSIVEDCDNAKFKTLIDEGIGMLIDVRTAEEFEGGHIEGATNIDFYAEDFDAQIEELDRNTPILVYCQAGGRSGQARDKFAAKNFVEVYNLANGYGAW